MHSDSSPRRGGLPVRNANPDGDSKSAPTVALPTMPSCQPTPARTRRRLSAGMYSKTLQNSAFIPSAVSRTVSLREAPEMVSPAMLQRPTQLVFLADESAVEVRA